MAPDFAVHHMYAPMYRPPDTCASVGVDGAEYVVAHTGPACDAGAPALYAACDRYAYTCAQVLPASRVTVIDFAVPWYRSDDPELNTRSCALGPLVPFAACHQCDITLMTRESRAQDPKDTQ